MDFDFSEKVARLRTQLEDFMRFHVEPANRDWHDEVSAGRYPVALIERLKSRAFSEDLWNLFLPGLTENQPGQRLSNVEYAPLAEIMGRIHWASEVFNCSAPDTGNMELLNLFATPAQRAEWLDPLLIGEIRSCFAMSEPDAASSDARNIRTTIACKELWDAEQRRAACGKIDFSDCPNPCMSEAHNELLWELKEGELRPDTSIADILEATRLKIPHANFL